MEEILHIRDWVLNKDKQFKTNTRYSVKRIMDGKVFFQGQTIFVETYGITYIRSFCDNKIRVQVEDGGYVQINQIRHCTLKDYNPI